MAGRDTPVRPPPRFANPPVVKTPVTNPLPANPSANWHLFNDRYACITNQRNLYSAAYLKISGVVATGEKEMDEAMGSYPVNVWLTPAAMAIFLNEGASFQLINRPDAAPIYQHLQQHLIDWKNHIQQNINLADPPLEDLRMFEELARLIWPIAQAYIKTEAPSFGFLSRQLGFMRGLSREAPPTSDGVTPAGAPYAVRPHEPVYGSILKALSDRQGPTKRTKKPWEED